MDNTNSPAFPIEDAENATAYGITKLEYAMIHCTAPIPENFKPEFTPRPEVPYYFPPTMKCGDKTLTGDQIQSLLKKHRDDDDNWYNEKDLPPTFKDQMEGWKDHRREAMDKLDEWLAGYNMAKDIQWRYHYCIQLLKYTPSKTETQK